MEIWGGIECTINRVGEQYFNQLTYQGHQTRKEDLALIADLGIDKIRYPILWEDYQPLKNEVINWGDLESRLNYFKEKNIDVIAGLVHHGSGPVYVHMEKPCFAEGLAAFAAKVAEKFPWLEHYTPVNEPLTTARFCGLYGIWYPHGRSDSSFLRILFNECRATILAMDAIRKVNPVAKLVHTEDLGKIHSTSALKYQADFENERRWLGIDLLCGKVDQKHPMYAYCTSNGICKKELDFFLLKGMPPDVLGFNYYITSERYLDEDLQHYPVHSHGGNNQDTYADVEAIRVQRATVVGTAGLLREAWERFRLPLAITETHLYCGREDQLRWVKESMDAVLTLEKEGIDLRALTIWSLLGAFGWDKLLTQPGGNYESGVFDIRSGSPRPTALQQMVKHLTSGKAFSHPVLEGKGWWRRNQRIIYPPHLLSNMLQTESLSPVLIIGATGTLGQAFAKICQIRNIHCLALSRSEMNMIYPQQIEEVIQKFKPWAVINAAGFVRVDDAEIDYENCFLSNTAGPVNLAAACSQFGIKLLTFSSDLVFDGNKKSAYHEDDCVNPLNVYGASKAKAEEEVLRVNPDALVIRTSAFFSPWDNYNFVSYVIDSLRKKQSFQVADDVYISPTYVPDLVNASIDLLIDDEKGIWHLANNGAITWADLAKEVAYRGHFDASFLQPVPLTELRYPALRPNFSVLTSKHGLILPTLELALDRFFESEQVEKQAS